MQHTQFGSKVPTHPREYGDTGKGLETCTRDTINRNFEICVQEYLIFYENVWYLKKNDSEMEVTVILII